MNMKNLALVLADRPAPSFELALDSGRTIEVDGKKVPIPVGVGGTITGAAIKGLSGTYPGHALMVSDGNTWKRVRDLETVSILDGKQFKTDRPKVRTVPRFSRD